MNYSDLPLYLSKENLTTRFVDYSNVFLLPSICYIGIVTSFVCLLVTFKREEAYAKTLDYIFVNSAIDFLFLLIESFLVIIRCGALCPYGYTFAAKFYEIYMFLYAGYILVTSQVLLNIYVSFDRLKMFSTKKSTNKPTSIFKVYAVCVTISAIVNSPSYLISKEVVLLGVYKPNGNSSEFDYMYIRTTRKEFQTEALQYFLTALVAVKDMATFCVLCLMSIIVCIRYKLYSKSRSKLIRKVSTGKIIFFLLITN